MLLEPLLTIPVCIAVTLPVEVKLVRIVVSGYNVGDGIELCDAEIEYLVLVKKLSLLLLTSAVVNELTGGMTGMEDAPKFVGRVEAIGIMSMEAGVRSGEIEVVMIGGVTDVVKSGGLVEIEVATISGATGDVKSGGLVEIGVATTGATGDVKSGGLVEIEVVMRAGEVAEAAVTEGGLSDKATTASDREA